jgi:hypothetical protein
VSFPQPSGPASLTVSKEGHTVAVLAVAPDGLTVQAAVYPRGKAGVVSAGPYRFATPAEANAFLDEALEALVYLGCTLE